MKGYLFKLGLVQIWFVLADYVFFYKELVLLTIYFFLAVDLVYLIVYFIRTRRGEDVKASIDAAFDILPYKWLGIGAFVEAICWMHWEEYSAVCLFLLATMLLGYIFDTMDRYKVWKKEHKKKNSCS